MSKDIFGNLRDWGPVLEQIKALSAQGKLDSHQAGLLRILRYRDNWRLRESVLNGARNMRRPTDELLRGILDIMMDDTIYHDARILAAEALAALVGRARPRGDSTTAVDCKLVLEKLGELVNTPSPPFFQRAIDSVRNDLEKSTAANRGKPTHGPCPERNTK